MKYFLLARAEIERHRCALCRPDEVVVVRLILGEDQVRFCEICEDELWGDGDEPRKFVKVGGFGR